MNSTVTPPDLHQAAARFRALSDETRLKILDVLAGGERCVCELVSALDVSQPLLSFHLRALKEAGLVADRREGRWIYYELARNALKELEAITASLARRNRGPWGCCS
jgi:ArsR family transcriptional regulator